MLDLETQWAHDTFSHAELGDLRRTRRLVDIGAAAARTPGGTVTSVLPTPAQKEGAFRLLESSAVETKAIARAVHVATARLAAKHSWIYVALDQSSLTFVDSKDVRGLGKVGHGTNPRLHGLQVMTGLALEPDGTPLGVCATRWFSRPEQACWGKQDTRPVEDRESGMWLDALDDVEKVFAEHAPTTRPWFQVDRGGDFWRLFDLAREHGFDVTVRASHNRVIESQNGPSKLLEAASRARTVGRMTLERRREGRVCRMKLSVRARPVTVLMADEKRPRQAFDLWVVQVREVGRPSGCKRILWTLLTTRSVDDLASALEVVRGYAMRWRVEEFHRTWKAGHCQLERSQLRSPEAIQRWAIILAAVAARIERLKQLSRTQGDVDALVELTQDEIDAAILLSRTKRWRLGAKLTLAEAVILIAQIGGYTGKSSGGPPGSVTIGRGLERIAPAAAMARHLRQTSG
ncbi:IS4 family transposase [Nannocystaceae bacterium ST9]